MRVRRARLGSSPWRFLLALQVAQWIAVLLYARNHPHEWGAFGVCAVFVGLPIALACVYRLASAIGGRWLGALTAVVWVVTPFATIRLFDPRYRYQYKNLILPRALGLTESGEFAVMVVLLVACLLVYGAVRGGRPRAFLAGVVIGVAGMVDAAGLLFVAAALAALLAARRPRQLLPFALGLAPGILVVLVRGTGDAVAFGSWSELRHNGTFIREYFYSLRILEYLPIAGAIAIARRSIPAAVLIGGWFAVFLAIQGSSSDVLDYTFWRVLLPALPAYVVLASALPLLVPAPRAFREAVLARRTARPGRDA